MEAPPFMPDRVVGPTTWPWASGPALLVGGSFDPVHQAHTALADEARRLALSEDAWLVFVPAARSPHKAVGPQASDEQRLEMLALGASDLDRWAIWTEELERESGADPSYWIDTLRRARELGATGLRFLVGADQAVAFHRWRDPREILALAQPVIIPRGGFGSPGELVEAMRETEAWSERELDRWRGWFVQTDQVDVSATRLRESLADPDARNEPIDHLDEGVREYILDQCLYLPSTGSADG